MKNQSLKEVALLFLKLGTTAFGGPAAHIAMMQQEVVQKKKWISEQHFLDLVGATNLIPGPNSTEMAIHLGNERAGVKGLIVAGLCFILPAVFITAGFAWLYKEYGHLPDLQAFIYGIKPAIIAIIIAAVYPMAKKALKTIELGVIGITALVFCFAGVNEMAVLFGAGAIAMLLAAIKRTDKINGVAPLLLMQSGGFFSALNIKLLFTFLKIGSVLYGSGYVLFAFLDSELVSAGLLTRQQLMDAVAIGQFTPGPVFSAVTFIGYQINGVGGAVMATVGVFLPSFIFVWLLNPLIPKMRQSKQLAVFLDAVNVASVAIIAFVCFQMCKDAVHDWRSISIGVISLLVSFTFKKLNSVFVVIGGALLGYLLLWL